MSQIYDHCWKTQRELRANRSFIRLFWWYQDKVGDDNFATFAQTAQKSRPNVRLKIQAQVNNYCNCFIERESSAHLCFELQTMNQKIYQEIDVWRLEDAQFDMLLGKEPSDPRFQYLNSNQALSEVQIISNQQMQIPYEPKGDSSDIHARLQNMNLEEKFYRDDRTLRFMVEEVKPMKILQQSQQEQQRLAALQAQQNKKKDKIPPFNTKVKPLRGQDVEQDVQPSDYESSAIGQDTIKANNKMAVPPNNEKQNEPNRATTSK